MGLVEIGHQGSADQPFLSYYEKITDDKLIIILN